MEGEEGGGGVAAGDEGVEEDVGAAGVDVDEFREAGGEGKDVSVLGDWSERGRRGGRNS